MKILICMFLALFLCLSLTACKEEASETTNPESPSVSSTPDSPSETTLPASTPAATDKTEIKLEFEEITVVDNEFFTLKITDVVCNNPQDYTINVSLKNKSADSTYEVDLRTSNVNGVRSFASHLSGWIYETVDPGQVLTDSLHISDKFPEDIGEYTDISLSYSVENFNDPTAEPVAENTIHIYPKGESAVTQYERQSKLSDQVLVDNDAVTVTYIGYQIDEIGTYYTNFYVENKTETSVVLISENESVNGIQVDATFVCSVSGGYAGYYHIMWDDFTLARKNISQVAEIELDLSISYNVVDGKYTEKVEENVTIIPFLLS